LHFPPNASAASWNAACPRPAAVAAIRSGSETISSSVETVRTLVDEFATVARFPTAQPLPSDTGQIVASALACSMAVCKHQDSIRSSAGTAKVMADPEH